MKRKTLFFSFFLVLFASMTISLSSCSSDDDKFNYPLETLYGTWSIQRVNVSGKWYDVTTYPYTKFGASITFYENGKYYGSGYFGTGSGTYKLSGNKITTYYNGEVYMTYTVKSLTDDTANMIMDDGSSTMEFYAKKK